MEQHYDSEIRLDNQGRPDLDYYITEARRLRSLAIAELFQGIGVWLKLHIGKEHAFPLRPGL